MPSERFLSAVADYYLNKSNTDLSDLCLIFPNKRAAIYFRRYFKLQAKNVTFIPTIKTIGAFNEEMSDRRVADHIELMFILYKAYSSVMTREGKNPHEFDKFAYWCNMILSDFDDIDAEMADAKSLFTNIKRLKEISSNFLTPEQLDVIKAIWGQDAKDALTPKNDRFWNHIENNDKNGGKNASYKFFKLWQVLYPIYLEFRKILDNRNLGYPGLISREISEKITKNGLDELAYSRIGFVGFNKANVSLARIMKYLDSRDAADFFWDILPNEKYCKNAGKQIHLLSDEFKMPRDFEMPKYTHNECQISVYGIPSNTLQTKAACNIINGWKEFINTSIPDNTVVVLPDPSLLSPLLNGLSKDVGQVNITMGLSYKDTPFATLLRAIVSMHLRPRYNKGEVLYYYEDIISIVQHPHLRNIAMLACTAIKDDIDKNHRYNISVDTLRNVVISAKEQALAADEQQSTSGYDVLLAIFANIQDSRNAYQIKEYIQKIISTLRIALKDSASAVNTNSHEFLILEAYQAAIEHVFDCVEEYGVSSVGQGYIFTMLERLLSLSTINMSGTPLKGLQVMGVLETRALDFENVIILSMNERIYPRRNRQHTLIPQQIRHAYGLPASNDSELEYSYYFYRLFSRAKRVVCLYDSRANGAGNGAMSRYLLQFKYFSPTQNIYFSSPNIHAHVEKPRFIIVRKDKKVMKELQAFKDSGPNGINLSATALKKYRSCPLAFYLKHVKRVSEDDEPTAFMDAATYGSVMHNVMEDLFLDQRKTRTDPTYVNIDEQCLAQMNTHAKGNNDPIHNRVKDKINELYHKGAFSNTSDMPAESQILSEIMADFIHKILEKEINYVTKYGPFKFVGAEESIKTQWQITPNHKVNFRLDIDRHDALTDTLHRFIDYKTGSDSPCISSIEDLFSLDDAKANDACLQLLTYSAAYSDITSAKFDISPVIYQLKKAFDVNSDFLGDGGPLQLSNDKKVLIWHNTKPCEQWQEDFLNGLHNMVNKIFDDTTPFTQTQVIDNCRYCKFIQICGRVVPEKKF